MVVILTTSIPALGFSSDVQQPPNTRLATDPPLYCQDGRMLTVAMALWLAVQTAKPH